MHLGVAQVDNCLRVLVVDRWAIAHIGVLEQLGARRHTLSVPLHSAQNRQALPHAAELPFHFGSLP